MDIRQRSNQAMLNFLRKRESVLGAFIADLESANQDTRSEKKQLRAVKVEIARLETKMEEENAKAEA